MAEPQTPTNTTDPNLVGLLVYMSGGGITDAIMAQFAIDQFERSTGRKVTVSDLAMIVRMMKAMQ